MNWRRGDVDAGRLENKAGFFFLPPPPLQNWFPLKTSQKHLHFVDNLHNEVWCRVLPQKIVTKQENKYRENCHKIVTLKYRFYVGLFLLSLTHSLAHCQKTSLRRVKTFRSEFLLTIGRQNDKKVKTWVSVDERKFLPGFLSPLENWLWVGAAQNIGIPNRKTGIR